MSKLPFAYAHNPMDRASDGRSDANALSELVTTARILPVWKQGHLVAEGPRLLTVNFSAVEAVLADSPVYLGKFEGEAWFAADISGEDEPALGGEFKLPMEVSAHLPPEESGLMAYARALVLWHRTHQFCGVCGSKTRTSSGGHARQCTNEDCGHRTFPRTDSAVITLVTDPSDEHVLMGRQPQWPEGMYSVVAGFLEPGETLEACVQREVFEETGIRVTDVTYVASQPWPFPTSIMLGFEARALTTEINLEDDELEDARWWKRHELDGWGDMFDDAPGFKLPGKQSIARYLLDRWRERPPNPI